MRPIPIPDDLVWQGARRTTLVRPDVSLDDELINPVPLEVVVDEDEIGQRMTMLIALEEGDLLKLMESGGKFLLMVYGDTMPVFALENLES